MLERDLFNGICKFESFFRSITIQGPKASTYAKNKSIYIVMMISIVLSLILIKYKKELLPINAINQTRRKIF